MPYNGGRVQEGEIHVYLTFWGSGWNQHQADKEHILEMFRYLNNSPFTGILTQYFDLTGHPSGQVSLSSYTDGSEVTPELVSQTKIELEAQKSIETQGWPAPSFDDTYVVLAAPGATEQAGFNTGCARHGFDSEIGAPFVFEWYPTQTEHAGCLEGRQSWEALQATGAFEFAQAATDPQPYNSFGSTVQSGWNRPKLTEVEGQMRLATYEIGEICGSAAGRVVQEAPEIWLPKVRDDYLLAEQGILCVAQDKEPVRYSLSVGGTQIPEPHQATVTGTVIPGGWPARYRFNVSDPATGYSAIIPAEFQPVVATKTGEVVSAKLPPVTGDQTYSVTLESYNALTEADPPLSTSTSVLTTSGSFTTPAWTPGLTPQEPTSPGPGSEALQGSVNPNGLATTYRFEYGPTTSYGSTTAVQQAGSGTSPVPVGATLTALPGATTYHYRLVATNAEGTSDGADQLFTTPAYPTIESLEVSEVTAGTARLKACLTGNGLQTRYSIEYGQTTSYGLQIGPISGAQNGVCNQNEVLTNLTAGSNYHVRIVATNSAGTVKGPDVTFTTKERPSYVGSFGGAGIGPGQFGSPNDVATDPGGNVYVADSGNSTVQKFTAAGTYISTLATSGSGDGQVNAPDAVATDAKGDVWVADAGNHRLEEFGPSGTYLRQISLAPAPPLPGESTLDRKNKPPYATPAGMDVGPYNEVWVSTGKEGGLYEFDETGSFIRSGGSRHGPELTDLAATQEGLVYVYAPEEKLVQKFSRLAEEASVIGSEGSGNGQFRGVSGIAVDAFENVWVADQGGDRVEEFERLGRYVTQFGGPGSGNGQFDLGPEAGIATSPTGYVYVVDSDNHRVERWFDPAGTPSFVSSFGGAGNGAGKFGSPSDAAVDPGGNIDVADSVNSTIQRFNADGTYISTIASSGSGDGQVRNPDAVATDKNGDIWIADAGNRRLEELGPSGTYLRQIPLEPPPPGATGTYVAVAGLDVGPSNEVWISSGTEGRLYEFGETGSFIRSATAPSGGPLGEATELAVDPRDGEVEVADPADNRIVGFNSSGEYRFTYRSGEGGRQFNGIAGIAVDERGHTWVADRQDGSVDELATSGRPLAQFGTPGSGNGQFSFGPNGGVVTTSPRGFVYVVDGGNKRVEKWSDPRSSFPFP